MSFNVKSSTQQHVNDAFKAKGLDGISLVGRLINAELQHYTEAADVALNRQFNTKKQDDAYQVIVDYVLKEFSFTEALGILCPAVLTGDDDMVEHNICLLASQVMMYENTWAFFKKVDLLHKVEEVLNTKDTPDQAPSAPIPSV